MKKQTSAAEKIALVVTTIAKPQRVLRALASGCQKHQWDFVVVGDAASPRNFNLTGCDYYSLRRQRQTGFKTAKRCPGGHYARKNIGYLLAIREGAGVIVETDDDNFPEKDFWQAREKIRTVKILKKTGWVNIYSYFSDSRIWPRGLPLTCISNKISNKDLTQAKGICCPIQQGLANDNPDVDAIYRLVLPLPQRFNNLKDIALGKGAWSPFNSQNTGWWKEAFALLYLPSYCSFRMTDIWRSLVAQRIAWENNWSILFYPPTVTQKRNKHNLLKDFTDEIPGYLRTETIEKTLSELSIKKGVNNIPDAMRLCYKHLVRKNIFDKRELWLLESWLGDLEDIGSGNLCQDCRGDTLNKA